VEIDIGMGRCGVRPGGEAVSFAKRIARMKGINLRGIMGYEGHVVSIEDFEERRRQCLRAVERLPEAKSVIEKEGSRWRS
jgi:D-serine deaminase-like pyridoxal phosphate-dependent protein